MAKETPLQTVKRLHGDKDTLVASIVDYARDADEDKSGASERLKVMSNRKLLRMADRAKAVKDVGGRDGLAARLAAAQGRQKDADYIARLSKMPAGRVLDMLGAAQRANRGSR